MIRPAVPAGRVGLAASQPGPPARSPTAAACGSRRRLRQHQRRLSGRASTRPLREFGAFQVFFAAESEATLLAQLRRVPHAKYRAQRRRLADGEAGRQSLRRLHRDPAGTVTALLQQHAARRAALATPRPLPSLEHTD